MASWPCRDLVRGPPAQDLLVKANGALTLEQEQQFREGVSDFGQRTRPAGLGVVRSAQNPWYEVRLFEDAISRLPDVQHFGRLVEKLKRVRIGPSNWAAQPDKFRSWPSRKWRNSSARFAARQAGHGAAGSPGWQAKACPTQMNPIAEILDSPAPSPWWDCRKAFSSS